jgi:hypothetical protein
VNNPDPTAGVPRILPLGELECVLHMRAQISFRVGAAPLGFLEALSNCGRVDLVRAGDVKTASHWWLIQRINFCLCQRN